MGFFDRLFGKPPVADAGAPFMEHPTGEFASAVEAMADAIARLRRLATWDGWITFSAQGMGHDEDSERHAEIRFRQDVLQLDEPVDAERACRHAGVARSGLTAVGANYSIAAASPADAARLMDAIFRNDLGIRPFPDQRDDYAVGAEW